VCHANPAALQLLGPQVRRVNLGLSGSRDGSALDDRVRAVAVTRMPFSATVHHRGQSLGLRISPLPRTSTVSGGLGKLVDAVAHPTGFHHRASVVLTVTPLLGERTAGLHEQARRWQLTPAEEALWRALRAGRTPTEHATARGVKISTVRSQVRALLDKSGHRNLRELMT
jgi:DNA-binding CsgD family transcriptional regulator